MHCSPSLRRLLAAPAAFVFALALVILAPELGASASAQGSRYAPGSSCASPVTTVPTGPATVSAASTPYGRALVVGSGANAGCSLYYLTSDQPQLPYFACTTPPFGPSCDRDIWPALLTKGAPVAGPGVNPTLLGMVSRSDVLSGQSVEQVTYAGHALYQFVLDKAPGQTHGEDLFDSFTSPPGIWYLVSPGRGLAAPGRARLSPMTATVKTSAGRSTETILSATLMGDNSSGTPTAPAARQFPVYTFSADVNHQSSCTEADTPSGVLPCPVIWPPLLTNGRPEATGGLNPHGLGIIVRPDGSHQVTWDGRPLYVFIKDALPPTPTGTATGQGLGSQFGGTGFHLVKLG